jgi:uncharacterized integral membrane protein
MLRTLRRLLVGVTLLMVALLAAVAVNQEQVSLRFLVWQTPEWSVFWWIFMAFVAGGVLGHVLALFSTVPLRLERRRLQKALVVAEQEASQLKSPTTV